MVRYISIVLLVTALAYSSLSQAVSISSEVANLELKVEFSDGTIHTTENIPLRVVFTNNGDKTVRLLNVFDSSLKLGFLTLNITNDAGASVSTRGTSKVSFASGSMRYVELKKGESYQVDINAVDALFERGVLKSGIHHVSVTYRNQYGEDCFHGTRESSPIIVNVTGQRGRDILSRDHKVSIEALEKAILEHDTEVVQLGLKSALSFEIKKRAAEYLAQTDDKKFVANLTDALSQSRSHGVGGTETQLMQNDLRWTLITGLEKLTGLQFGASEETFAGNIVKLKDRRIDDETIGKEIERIVKECREWLKEKPLASAK